MPQAITEAGLNFGLKIMAGATLVCGWLYRAVSMHLAVQQLKKDVAELQLQQRDLATKEDIAKLSELIAAIGSREYITVDRLDDRQKFCVSELQRNWSDTAHTMAEQFAARVNDNATALDVLSVKQSAMGKRLDEIYEIVRSIKA